MSARVASRGPFIGRLSQVTITLARPAHAKGRTRGVTQPPKGGTRGPLIGSPEKARGTISRRRLSGDSLAGRRQ